MPLAAQLSPDNVASLRTLSRSRYDFVDRNYTIVMQYQKQHAIQFAEGGLVVIKDGAKADNSELNIVEATVIAKSGQVQAGTIVNFTFNGQTTAIPVNSEGIAQFSINSNAQGTFPVTAEVLGNTRTVNVTFTLDPSIINMSELTAESSDAKIANGVDAHNISLQLSTLARYTLHDIEVQFMVDGVLHGSSKSDDSGKVVYAFPSTKSGTFAVTAKLGDNTTAPVNVTFERDMSAIQLGALAIVTNNAKANNNDKNSVKLQLSSHHSDSVEGIVVNFNINGVTGTPATATSDANGEVIYAFSSGKRGINTVTAEVYGQTQSTDVNFTVDPTTIQFDSLTAEQTGSVVADGSATNNIIAQLSSTTGDSLADVEVAFTFQNQTYNIKSDASGKAIFGAKSIKSGNFTVTAIAGEQITKTVAVKFIGDISTATITNAIYSYSSSGEYIGLKINVIDKNGNPIEKENIMPMYFYKDSESTPILANKESDSWIPSGYQALYIVYIPFSEWSKKYYVVSFTNGAGGERFPVTLKD